MDVVYVGNSQSQWRMGLPTIGPSREALNRIMMTQQSDVPSGADPISKVENHIAKVEIAIERVEEQIADVGVEIKSTQKELDRKDITSKQ